jgi:hypothetical protein
VDLTRGLGAPALGWTGRNRAPAELCPTGSPSSPSESPSASPSETSPTETETETPSETPSEEPSEVMTETIIEVPCRGEIEPMGLQTEEGREAANFGAQNDLRPVGGTFLVPNPAGGPNAQGSLGEGCLFVFSFTGQSSGQGSPTQRDFNFQLPAGTSDPLLYYQYGPKNWRPVPNQARGPNGTLSVVPDLYGYFQVFSKIMNPKPNIGDTYVFPNPSKTGDVPTLHIEVDRAEKLSYRIYDVSGDLITEGAITSAIKTENGKPCYEQALDLKLFSSGTYLFAVTAERGGEKDRQTGRFSVLK